MKTLDKSERKVLLKKYIKSGLEYEEALKKLNKFHDYLKDMRKKLSAVGKSDQDMEARFKQEFWDLCQKLEK